LTNLQQKTITVKNADLYKQTLDFPQNPFGHVKSPFVSV